ncbi:Hint domain-containing protein [Streptomyces sp. NPDC091212]|uniref:Hint domain-containing protein n=1 Tax=Streptomyces sp. NPDC091212 TaxID=3155191 RepID=UPI003449B148
MRGLVPRTDVRLLGLRTAQRGQGAVEYVGLVAVVAAIVGALVMTGVGPTLADGIRTQVCRITGGADCGGGAYEGEDRAGGPEDPLSDTPGASEGVSGGTGEDTGGGPGANENANENASDGQQAAAPGSQARIDYESALKELQDAQADEKSDSDKAAEAAKELAKILADELGITDALDCVTKGDMGACTETLINVLLNLVGGAAGKLAAKYGAPWKWKKAVSLVRALKKHGGDLYDGIKGLIKNRKRVGKAEDRLADARKRLDAENPKKPDGRSDGKSDGKADDRPDGKPNDKPPTCPVAHSFLPGTPVLLADGTRLAIEKVRVDDVVRATDPVTGRTLARRVTRTFTTHADKEFTRLTVRTDTGTAVVTATDTHPFYLTDLRRWRAAGDIRPGALLLAERGASLKVLSTRHYVRQRTTHDLTVQGLHTYYVGVGTAAALVHNNTCEWPVADGVAGPAAGKTLKRPHRRHTIKGSAGSEVKESNTVILDGMQKRIDDDIKGISQGKASLDPDGNTYRINGRGYEVKSNGTVFPKEGPGLVKLDRVEYSALQLMAKGDAKSLKQLEMNPKFKENPQAVEKARRIIEGTYS